MSVVTSVPALALKAVLGSRIGADQVGAFGQIMPDGRVLLVHRVAAGDERHDAAGAQLVERLGQEVIVNGAGQGRLAAVVRVENSIVAERDIADHRVEVIVGQCRFLEAFGENRRVGIEALRDPGGNTVEFDAGSAASGKHLVRHEAEEMAHAHRGFEDPRSLRKTEAPHRLPHRLDDARRGEMSVRRRGARGLVFVPGQEFAELTRDRLPFLRRIRPEGVRHRSPSRVSGKLGLLRFRCGAVFRLDLFQRADGLDVGEGFFAKAPFADAVGFSYPEVS